ncbi:succinyldiaminopimelate transaminase [Cryptosporangium sp. NPDC051539]|uniref:succinyldiaminopimelate transaminase n=1 Tax=Cryptosporangium sp. NPDC051539 TaxID=3363962 RepID=UPI0037B1040E
MSGRPSRSASLPDFPWDTLAPFGKRAREHPDGIVDLSIGTPVDPTPAVVRDALVAAADAPGYPLTAGTPALRAAMSAWVAQRLACSATVGVLPTIGSKELVAWAPTLLGLGPSDTVLFPELAYPTYDVGIRLAGAVGLRSDATTAAGPGRVAAIWVNSPSNPTGRVLGVPHLRKVVAWARERGTIVISDECYLELGWDVEPVSVLSDEVSDGDVTGLIAVHSLSKRSNLAGYRAGFVAGDPAIVGELLAVRKHGGMIVPGPVQAAMVAALGDVEHVAEQRARYAARRTVLREALVSAGFRIDHSEAGLYLWATRGEPCWDTVAWLADRGILVAPGAFYGPTGAQHVRVALTATDERVAAAVKRLGA